MDTLNSKLDILYVVSVVHTFFQPQLLIGLSY